MKKVMSNTFPAGEVKVSTTSITVTNNTAKTQDITVPADEKWVIETIKTVNPDDVARVIGGNLYLTSSKSILITALFSQSANANVRVQYPSLTVSTIYNWMIPELVLGPGMTLSFTWAAGGASSGGTDADGLVIMYRKLNII